TQYILPNCADYERRSVSGAQRTESPVPAIGALFVACNTITGFDRVVEACLVRVSEGVRTVELPGAMEPGPAPWVTQRGEEAVKEEASVDQRELVVAKAGALPAVGRVSAEGAVLAGPPDAEPGLVPLPQPLAAAAARAERRTVLVACLPAWAAFSL